MSKTVPVEFGGRWFWAYDVSLGILLLGALHVAAAMPPGQRPARAEAVLEDLRTHIRVGASFAFLLDNDGWSEPQRKFVRSIIAEAGRRLRERGIIPSADASQLYTIDGKPYFLAPERPALQLTGS